MNRPRKYTNTILPMRLIRPRCPILKMVSEMDPSNSYSEYSVSFHANVAEIEQVYIIIGTIYETILKEESHHGVLDRLLDFCAESILN